MTTECGGKGPSLGAACTIWLPMRTHSTLNLREHFAVKAKRVAKERADTALLLLTHDLTPAKRGRVVRIHFMRIAPRALDEGDNLTSAMKAIRDELATHLGISDAPKAGITWAYSQQKGKPKQYGVRIDVYVDGGNDGEVQR